MKNSGVLKKAVLPKGWRLQVVKTLANKGFTVTERQVTDVKRGHIKNPVLTKNILTAIRKVAVHHKKSQQQFHKIRKDILKRA